MLRYDVVIVGAGITGITLANLFAERLKKKVLIIEKRDHIGGLCYDYPNEHGLLVNRYGAHIFHTKNEEVWHFLNRYTEFNDYVHFVKIFYDGEYYDWPITLDTINKVYGTSLDAEGAKLLLEREAYDNGEDNFENAITRQIGVLLYEMFIKNYSEKMWGRPARELSSQLAFRVPIRLDNDKRLFTDPFQGVPKHGYTHMFQNMLANRLIEVMLDTDYREIISKIRYTLLFVTSPIDEYYNYCYGKLEYRGMRFEWQTFEQESYLPAGTVNTPDHPTLLRLEEPKKYYQQDGPTTSICLNYPSGEGQYYPMMTGRNLEVAERYRALADKERNVHCLGRLGCYMYINMDQAVAMAINKFRELTGVTRI